MPGPFQNLAIACNHAGRGHFGGIPLDQKKIVPHATYEKIKDMIIAKQGADASKKK